MKIYDSDVRKLLFTSFQQNEEYNNADTVVINEMDVCSGICRADVAVVNGRFHGYEIKSRQDNLDRLPRQIKSYNQVFDTMTIVACDNHIDRIKEIIPAWWGIIRVTEKDGEIVLTDTRKAKQNEEINIQSVALLLWRDEMIELLLTYGGVTKGYSSKTRFELSKMIIKNVSASVIDGFVRCTLKSRTDWKAVSLQPLNDDLHCIRPNS